MIPALTDDIYSLSALIIMEEDFDFSELITKPLECSAAIANEGKNDQLIAFYLDLFGPLRLKSLMWQDFSKHHKSLQSQDLQMCHSDFGQIGELEKELLHQEKRKHSHVSSEGYTNWRDEMYLLLQWAEQNWVKVDSVVSEDVNLTRLDFLHSLTQAWGKWYKYKIHITFQLQSTTRLLFISSLISH